ncbi:MAG TPA: hypothetical protein VKH19_08565 [Gemmatimonadaceae bacterium]|nr:hypothetical protein [Gemmatimonadaceae bacterium]
MHHDTRMRIVRLLIGGSIYLLASALHAQKPGAEPIRDNSFLIEEAYNQDPGVVQHINTFARPTTGSAWGYTFTQEWPVRSQRHQLSYMVPVFEMGAPTGMGVGDFAVNYRYQLTGLEAGLALAPRVSLVLPTGDATRGTGTGSASVQLMLPASFSTSHVALHANAGLASAPRAHNAAGNVASATSFTAGGSVIWLASSTFNVLVESVWNRNASVVAQDAAVSTDHVTVAPGIRWAHNLSRGVQIVPGVAYALGVGAAHDRSVFLYLSIEHPFTH